MRSVPKLRFYFDTSVGRGRELEDLIRRAADADRELGLRDDERRGALAVARRRRGRPVDGILVLDKPSGDEFQPGPADSQAPV